MLSDLDPPVLRVPYSGGCTRAHNRRGPALLTRSLPVPLRVQAVLSQCRTPAKSSSLLFITILKFMIIFEQGAPHFYFVLDPTNYIAGLVYTVLSSMCMRAKLLQWRPTLCNSMDYRSPPDSSVNGIPSFHTLPLPQEGKILIPVSCFLPQPHSLPRHHSYSLSQLLSPNQSSRAARPQNSI